MLSANALNLDRSKILLSGKELTHNGTGILEFHHLSHVKFWHAFYLDTAKFLSSGWE